MILYLFAGPNGSGKSTIIAEFIKYHGLDEIEYVCPDIYASSLFSDIADVYDRYTKAMEFAEHKRKKLLKKHLPFIMETVLSRTDKLDFVKAAKECGYRVVSVFVSTNSPDINIERVKKRVAHGGHDVPEEKLRERFKKSMGNLPLLVSLSDEIYLYDNSNRPKIVASIIDGKKYISNDAPEWAQI